MQHRDIAQRGQGLLEIALWVGAAALCVGAGVFVVRCGAAAGGGALAASACCVATAAMYDAACCVAMACT